MEFVWTVSLGQVLSTLVLCFVIVMMYGAVLYHVSRYKGRIASLEADIAKLKIDLRALTISLTSRFSDAVNQKDK